MLYRVVLLLGVARVSGFAQTPSDDLSGRGKNNAPSSVDPYGVCDSSGVDSEGCLNLIRAGQTSVKKPHKKMCFKDNFCYVRWNLIGNCADYYAGCQVDRGTSQCQNYNRMRDNFQCPDFEEGGESNWCIQQLTARTKVDSCADQRSQSVCEDSYTRKAAKDHDMEFKKCPKDSDEGDDGCVTAALKRAYEANDMYQQCEWGPKYKGDTEGCRGAKGLRGERGEEIFDAVTFCGAFCERRKAAFDSETTEDDLVPLNVEGMDKKCNQGDYSQVPSDYPNGLPARLSNSVVCKRNYYTLNQEQTWSNGCDFFGPDMSVAARMDWGRGGGSCGTFLNATTNNYEVVQPCTPQTGCDFVTVNGVSRPVDCTGKGPLPTSRCDPKSTGSCSDELLEECQKWPWTSAACGSCNPACNCMQAGGTPCGPAQILCCDDDDECVVCDDIVPKIEQSAYTYLQ